MTQVFLPKNLVQQKLDRDMLPKFNELIKNKVEELYNLGTIPFIVQDGPPYANGGSHLGHYLNKSLKDAYVKYYLTTGHKVRFSFGWDCHGLPIENKAKSMPGDLLDNCRAIALKFREIQKNTMHLFGVYSTESDYMTLNDDFVQREKEIFNKLQSAGLIYKKKKPTWYSPYLNTVLANSEIEYKTLLDESVYFLLKIDSETAFLVWTTTEWTVAGNQAVCLNSDIKYCKTKAGLICSEKFATQQGLEHEPFDVTKIKTYYNLQGHSCPVLFDSFVTDDKTGIVHLAGGHGDEDNAVLIKNNIEPVNAVEKEHLLKHIKEYKIPEEMVINREPITHQYPVDWRLHEKVYKVLTEQTYLDFDWNKIKQACKSIKMSSKDRTRLETMLFSRKDWCLSRQRKWGVSIPDSEDILDVWFDSGTVFSMYDTPADLYIEGSDQHRGWFQSSVIIAGMLDKIPTKRILTHGFIMDETEEKFAKSKENYVALEALYAKYNPDVMRLWVLMSDYKNDVIFSDDSMSSAGKQYFKIRNLLRYFVNNLHITSHGQPSSELVDKINNLKKDIAKEMNEFAINKAIRNFVTFLTNYSSSLSEDKKNKFYESTLEDEYRVNMENDFYYLATELSKILFPFMPFLAMEIDNALHNTIQNETPEDALQDRK